LAARRSRLEKFAARYFSASGRIRLSPATTDLRQARRWLQAAGTALDGIVAKRTDVGYCSGDRKGMQKIKPLKTVDCVVGGFRYASHGHTLGSLLLGLYDDQGLLDHVGFISGFKKDQRDALLKRVEPLIAGAGFTGKAPGGPSRWSTKRSAEWEPLRPKLVAEVEYDQFTNGRFRHGAKLVRWRPDKAARQCTFEQVAQQGSGSLRLLRREAGRSARAKDH
jgi:ATP-dependent DNA ligase